MKYLFLKDKRRRTLVSKFELYKKVLRSLVRTEQYNTLLRLQAYKLLNQLPRDCSITRFRNRCVLINRPRAVYKKFGLSRLMFRKYASEG